jgi:hypothetical protein
MRYVFFQGFIGNKRDVFCKQELMETFDSEKDELKKKHEADLYEAEEKYETLIDRKIICCHLSIK